MSYEQHFSELAECILKGGTICKKDGSAKLTHDDFKRFADVHYTMPEDALMPLVDSWTCEEGEHEIKFMELMLDSMSELAETFLTLEFANEWDALEWSTIQEENYE